MPSTITQALRDMRALHSTNAGRLRGIRLRHLTVDLAAQGGTGTPRPDLDRLQAAINARRHGATEPASPEYLVLSDGTVIAALTAAARLQLPGYRLSQLQTRHQQQAVQALTELHRHTIADLADHRAAYDPAATAGHDPHPAVALRVAPSADITATRWVSIGADLDTARDTLAATCGTDPDQVLIVTAAGYGRYGTHRHRLDLPVLCAMHRIAEQHDVEPGVAGDWLDAEGATDNPDLDPQQIAEAFTAAYLGPYPGERDYTRHRMNQLGWDHALHDAGIPDRYLDLHALTHDWFSHHVRAIDCPVRHRVEVFHRHNQHGKDHQ